MTNPSPPPQTKTEIYFIFNIEKMSCVTLDIAAEFVYPDLSQYRKQLMNLKYTNLHTVTNTSLSIFKLRFSVILTIVIMLSYVNSPNLY